MAKSTISSLAWSIYQCYLMCCVLLADHRVFSLRVRRTNRHGFSLPGRACPEAEGPAHKRPGPALAAGRSGLKGLSARRMLRGAS